MPAVTKLKDKESMMLESLCRDSPFDDSVSFSRYSIIRILIFLSPFSGY
jgi:hypothetical protein